MALRRHKKKFWLILFLPVVIVVFGAGAVSVYLVRYSATGTGVCKSCHPEITSLWRASHGCPPETTSCFRCHSEKSRFMAAGWNIFKHVRDRIAPREYVADKSLTSQRCLECHEDVLDFGYEPRKKVIRFTHRSHLGENLDCIDCHKNAGHEYMTSGTNRPTVTECIDCHITEFTGPPKSGKCLNCHDVMLVPGRAWDGRT